MDFAYSEEQRMLTDSLRRVMADTWAFEKRRARFEAGKLDRQAWKQLAELGVTGLLVPQELGGFGETPATMLAVHLELGYGLVAEPVIPSAVMATVMLADSANQDTGSKWLSAMAEGSQIVTVAWQEAGERYSTKAVVTQAATSNGGYVLKGAKRHVWHAAGADAMIVNAVLAGEQALFLVPTGAPGVAIEDFPTFDLARSGNVTFTDVQLDASSLIAKGKAAEEIFAKGMDYAITALCAHAGGAMKRLIEITTEYLKTRKQFGQPLINFQALQHRLADMLIEQEMAVSHTYVAALALSDEEGPLRGKRVSMAKNLVSKSARFVGEQAVQLHGGMGMTYELEVGDFFKRLTFVEFLLGDSIFHQQRAQLLDVA